MTRQKKKTAEEAPELVEVKAVPKPKTIRCPLRGHKHDLLLVPHPERPDLVIAYCADRDVYQAPASESIRPVDPRMADFTYVVPKFEGD